jgi:hypothetical protein
MQFLPQVCILQSNLDVYSEPFPLVVPFYSCHQFDEGSSGFEFDKCTAMNYNEISYKRGG